MPRLSAVDKLIYFACFLIWAAAVAVFFLSPYCLRHVIAFSDDAVEASAETAGILWPLVSWFIFTFSTLALWAIPLGNRRPIFGIKNYQYGPPELPKIYPLFMKNKPPVWKSEREKRLRKTKALILLVVIMIGLLLFPLGLFSRESLCADGGIVLYNVFNSQTDRFTTEDVVGLEIAVDWHWNRARHNRWWNTRDWDIRMTFEMADGETYTFDQAHFRRDVPSENRYWLEAMLEIKQRFDARIIRYDRTEDLHRVIDEHDLNPKERDLLFQLFDQPY